MTILIDNGHGSGTPGKRSPDGLFREYSYTREIARRVVSELSDCGYDARLLVPETEDIPLTERCRRVNAICDEVGTANVILISIHVNASGSDGKWHNTSGWSAYTTPGITRSDLLAADLYEAAQKHLAGQRIRQYNGPKEPDFEGNFFELLDAGMEFLFKHLSISGKIVGLRREEKLEIPAEALREATINCLCHRAMEFYNATPQIAIYNDRIEISNPGRLAAGITPKNIKTGHFSHPYNPNIADVLFKSTFLENWGSGVGRILETCKEQGVPEPFWYEHDGFVTVTFPMPDTQGDTQDDTQGINDFDNWLLNQIKSAPSITSEKLASLSGKSVITIKRHLKKMKNVRYVGSGYSGHWEVDEK